MTVLQEILEWSKERPLWQRDALRRLVLNGGLSDDDILALTTICKSAHGLSERQEVAVLAKQHVPDSVSGTSPVSLISIFHHRGVNALAEGQTLKFAPGLTIVYGDNGAGKTGLWLQGHFLLASVGIRMLIELDGQLLWAEKKVLTPLATGDIDTSFERMRRLLLGSKSAGPLALDDLGARQLVNVMDFVRVADAVRPGTMGDYEFLCDSAHPSYMMQSWMLFAGPGHDNWSNRRFAREVEPILDRMVGIAETCVSSLEAVARRTMAQIVPAVSAETR